jgi:hypothetical protein
LTVTLRMLHLVQNITEFPKSILAGQEMQCYESGIGKRDNARILWRTGHIAGIGKTNWYTAHANCVMSLQFGHRSGSSWILNRKPWFERDWHGDKSGLGVHVFEPWISFTTNIRRFLNYWILNFITIIVKAHADLGPTRSAVEQCAGSTCAEFLPAGKAVSSAYYCDGLRRLLENVRRRRRFPDWR